MESKYREIDLSGLKRQSIRDRISMVNIGQFGKKPVAGESFAKFLDSLPDILAGRAFRELVTSIVQARKIGKPVIACMGAHVIKCGLSPIIIDLMSKGILTTVAMNGAGAIHDLEIALFGCTSEDVASGLKNGTFGMARETAEFLNRAAILAHQQQLGLGESIGKTLIEANAVNADLSIQASGYALGVPVTIHVALGTDITHMHPDADGAAYGDATMRDFRILTSAMGNLGGGGVLLNFGSAVILPEVVLKAFAILRNLGFDLSGIVGANFDFIQQYRSTQQIVKRMEYLGGKGYALTGHHEIMVPLLAHAVVEEIEKGEQL
ncbi:MAG: hypothetical protein QME62_00830 [Armatimonadota bacterium]|nr:hypothetical protein [Armatimonadota bacterium]